MFMYLLCIYKKPIILSLDLRLNFTMYKLNLIKLHHVYFKAFDMPFKNNIIRLHSLISMNIFFAMKKIIVFLDNCTLWWPIAAIEKNFQNREKNYHNGIKTFRIKKKIWNPKKISDSKKKRNYGIEKKIMESKKKLNQKSISESRKKFRIEKHVSESSNII